MAKEGTPEGGSKGGSKGGLGKFFKGLIFEEGVAESAPTASKEASTEEAEAPARSSAGRSGVTTQRKTADVNPELLKQLQDAVLAKPSIFTQFLDQLEALSEAGLGESKQYVAAVAVLKKGAGATPRKILNAIESLHAGILEGEKSSFADEINQWIEENVGEQKKELESVKAQITSKKRQVAKLQEEIAAAENEQVKLEEKIAGQTEKVEVRKQVFARSLEAAREWLDEHKKKITTHLDGKGE